MDKKNLTFSKTVFICETFGKPTQRKSLKIKLTVNTMYSILLLFPAISENNEFPVHAMLPINILLGTSSKQYNTKIDVISCERQKCHC